MKNNANLRHVQEILRHGPLATTERYLSLTITNLKEGHRKCHLLIETLRPTLVKGMQYLDSTIMTVAMRTAVLLGLPNHQSIRQCPSKKNSIGAA